MQVLPKNHDDWTVDTSPPGTDPMLMIRRDLFAAHALAGILASYDGDCRRPEPAAAAEKAFTYADAMLRQSARK